VFRESNIRKIASNRRANEEIDQGMTRDMRENIIVEHVAKTIQKRCNTTLCTEFDAVNGAAEPVALTHVAPSRMQLALSSPLCDVTVDRAASHERDAHGRFRPAK